MPATPFPPRGDLLAAPELPPRPGSWLSQLGSGTWNHPPSLLSHFVKGRHCLVIGERGFEPQHSDFHIPLLHLCLRLAFPWATLQKLERRPCSPWPSLERQRVGHKHCGQSPSASCRASSPAAAPADRPLSRHSPAALYFSNHTHNP